MHIGRSGFMTFALAMSCTTTLPPPRAPERTVPPVRTDLGSPAPGHGRVILDVVDGPAEVREVLAESTSSSVAMGVSSQGSVAVAGAQGSEQTSRPLCTTPCATDLLRGNHVLTFTLVADPRRTERADVAAGERVWVHRRALGQPRRLLPATFGLGIGVSILGLVVEGSAIAFIGEDNGAAIGLLVAGAVVALGGIGVMLSNTTVQPGAVTEWYFDETPARGAARAPAAEPPTAAPLPAPPPRARRPRRAR